ncbi:MAG: iron-containing alcohol dehydrogenase [Anaerolineaceae bacterium]
MFEFATAARIVFGEDSVYKTIPSFRTFGSKAFITLGLSETCAQPVLDAIKAQGIEFVSHRVKGEPTLETVQQAIEIARQNNVEMVIGMGGGSAIDTAKTVAAMLANPGELLDYLEVVGKGKALTKQSLPWVAIPTTAGTGSEVTRNAVIEVPEKKFKVSLRSTLILPRIAIVDPKLTLPLSPHVTATSGMDALSQVIEPFLSIKANPMVSALCREGIQRAGKSLRTAYFDGQNYPAREDMSLTSLLGGLALANAGLGAVHGFAAPLGGMFHARHGALCGRLLPAVMQVNFQALLTREPKNPALMRFHEIAILLTGETSAQPQQAVTWIEDTCELLEIPRLSAYGITKNDFPAIVEKAKQASSMKGNPITLTQDELTRILEIAF